MTTDPQDASAASAHGESLRSTQEQPRWHQAFGVMAAVCCCENRAHSTQHWALVDNLNALDKALRTESETLRAALEKIARPDRYDANDMAQIARAALTALESQ